MGARVALSLEAKARSPLIQTEGIAHDLVSAERLAFVEANLVGTLTWLRLPAGATDYVPLTVRRVAVFTHAIRCLTDSLTAATGPQFASSNARTGRSSAMILNPRSRSCSGSSLYARSGTGALATLRP